MIQALLIISAILTISGILWRRSVTSKIDEKKPIEWESKWNLRHHDIWQEIMAKDIKLYGHPTAPLTSPARDAYIKSRKQQEYFSTIFTVCSPALAVIGALFP